MEHKKVVLALVTVGVVYSTFYEKVIAFTDLPVNYGVAGLLALAGYFVYDRLVTKEQAEAKIMEYKQNIYPHTPNPQNPQTHIPTYTNIYPSNYPPTNTYSQQSPPQNPQTPIINPQQFHPATEPTPPAVEEKIDWKTKIQNYKR